VTRNRAEVVRPGVTVQTTLMVDPTRNMNRTRDMSQCARPQSGHRSEQSSIRSVQSPIGHLVQHSLLLDLCRLVLSLH